jgi:lysozyme family protein
MIANYKPFVDRMIMRYEGGYCWDRGDAGGPTKFGITCYDLAQHRHQKMTSMAVWAPIVKAMTLAEAEDIYATKYAVQCHFNDLGSGKDCCVFDFGVNSGSSRAIKFAQQVAGVTPDGVLGPISLEAINRYDSASFINHLCDLRMAFLRRLGNWPLFGRGWTARVADLRHYAFGLITPTAHPIITAKSAKAYEQGSESPPFIRE